MIRRVKNRAAVILAAAGMAFAVAAPAAASATSAGAAPDFTCPANAVCTFYGEELNNTPHVWWPGNRGERWYNFHNLGEANNPGSLRNNSRYCVWVDKSRGGQGLGDFRSAPGNERAFLVGLQHHFGWFFITALAACGPRPPKA